MKKITLAGGCFWGVEAYFSRVKGVLETEVGYSQGKVLNPTYDEVCRSDTGHAEVCQISYDEDVINLEKILKHFFNIINPTLLNMQGGDTGPQYRTGIYYSEEEDLNIITNYINDEQSKYPAKILTEVEKLRNFYPAEKYHQKYLEKNPGGYCHIDLSKVDSIR